MSEENLNITALHILALVVCSGSVRRATISSHISSPLLNQEKMASLDDDVMSVLS